MDKYTFTGNIGQDAETKPLDNGRTMVAFSVAIDKSYKDSSGQKVPKTKWISCVRFLNDGQSWGVAPYLKKGTKVLIEGEPESRAWSAQDGSVSSGITVNVRELELIGSAPQATGQTQQPQAQQPRPQPQPQANPVNYHKHTSAITDDVTDDLPF